jgi:hypothetical protein
VEYPLSDHLPKWTFYQLPQPFELVERTRQSADKSTISLRRVFITPMSGSRSPSRAINLARVTAPKAVFIGKAMLQSFYSLINLMQKDLTTDKRILLLDTRFFVLLIFFLSVKCKTSEDLWRLALDVRHEVVAVQVIVVLLRWVDVLENLLANFELPDEAIGECVFERSILVGGLKVLGKIRLFRVLVEVINLLLAVREASHFIASDLIEQQEAAWNMETVCVVVAVLASTDVVAHLLHAVFESSSH